MSFPSCATGAFVNGMENLSGFQSMIGKKLAVVLFYLHFNEPFPLHETTLIYENGSIPLITWEPWVKEGLDAICFGAYQRYIEDFIRSAKECGKPLLLRFAHEMNGNWYPWDGEHNGGETGAEKYKKAWLSIYDVRKKLKADKVKLVWCVNNTNQPDASWNAPSAYYPGDEFVDWVGVDGYNWGYGSWQSFDAVFGKVYQELTSLTQKPLMLGEFASADNGGSKADWIRDAFLKIKTAYPRIKLFCWFNINKERDWRVESSKSSETVFVQAISDSHFVEKMLE